ncbi:SAM-dependent methyltransferase [Paraburkholderia youngii]|uniref:DUF4214 domain-containing protein n=1 Tax=Paraburkholderia youngii TaxID=2782701 RepID=UPI003D226790
MLRAGAICSIPCTGIGTTHVTRIMTNAVLQDLIARVKAEAAAHAGPSDTTATAGLGHAVSPAGAGLDVAGLCAPASIEQLIIAEDEAFVDGAYRLVLRRESDPAGRANYVGQLKSGASRLVLLAKLRMSEEGRRTGVQVPGLRLAIGVTLAQRVLRHAGLSALASRAGRYADGVYARRRLSRSLVAWRGRFENTVGAVMRQAAQSEKLSAQSEELSRRVHDLQEQLRKDHTVAPEIIDAYYLAFEDANRGTRESVCAKLAIYDDWLATNVPRAVRLTHQIVDIGCGRGEWLSYVRERGHEATGIDVNPVMVKACVAQGFDARNTDALKYLRSLPTGSVAAVTGFLCHRASAIRLSVRARAGKLPGAGGRRFGFVRNAKPGEHTGWQSHVLSRLHAPQPDNAERDYVPAEVSPLQRD